MGIIMLTDKTSFNKILRNETTFYGLDRFYINLLLKSCPRLLVLQRVAQNAKSCSKVAKHNLFMPSLEGRLEGFKVPSWFLKI